MTRKDNLVAEALALARSYDFEEEHSRQVARIALMLFDELKDTHLLGVRDRLLLEVGALLHDIGWIEGQKGHHKTSRDLILMSNISGLSADEKTIVALIARYHRKALPCDSHDDYAKLRARSRDVLLKLASLVRLSDGLDRTHMSAVRKLKADVKRDTITLRVTEGTRSEIDKTVGRKKADLFESVFDRKLVIEW